MRARDVASALVAAWTACGAAGAQELESRLDRLVCGSSVITAQAACYGATGACVRETLTFHRPEATTIVAPHKRLASHAVAGDRKVMALDYHLSSWACAEGTTGGRYVAVVMSRTGGGSCDTCEFVRVYHPNGSLIASTLQFDGRGKPRDDGKAVELIGRMIVKPGPDELRPLYAK